MSKNELITVVVLGAVVLLLVTVWVNDRRIRRRSGTPLSGAIASFDEAFHPEAAKAMEIREVQQELLGDAPLPGEPCAPNDAIAYSKSDDPAATGGNAASAR